MRIFSTTSTLLIVISIIRITFCHDYPTGDDGLVLLTEDIYPDLVNENMYLFVYMYSETECQDQNSVCDFLEDEYQDARDYMASTPEKFPAQIIHCKMNLDDNRNPKSQEKYTKGRKPFYLFIADGDVQTYEGGMDEAQILGWLQQRTILTTVQLKNSAAVSQVVTTSLEKSQIDPLAQYAFTLFIGQANSSEFKMWRRVSRQGIKQKLIFLHTFDLGVAEEYNVTQPAIINFKTFNDRLVVYDGNLTSPEEIIAFIFSQSQPSMFRLDQERTKKIFEEKSPGLILFIGQDETGQISDDHKSKFKTLQEIAQELQDQIDITWTTLGSQIGKKIGPLFVSEGHENGILDKDLPAIWIYDGRKQTPLKYEFIGEWTGENLKQWVAKWKRRELTPHLRSEAWPYSHKDFENGIRVLVAKIWKKIVMNPKQNVLVMYFAPWCEISKKFTPKFEAIAKSFENVTDLVLAKLDATANEIEGLELEGYPTLIFYPENTLTGQVYKGHRNEADLVKWLKEKSSDNISWELYDKSHPEQAGSNRQTSQKRTPNLEVDPDPVDEVIDLDLDLGENVASPDEDPIEIEEKSNDDPVNNMTETSEIKADL